MSPHEQAEHLSAFLDGALEPSERASVGSHLATCATCRAMLDALRLTVTELRALPSPQPSEQDAWALRAAIARARRAPSRYARFAMAAGGAAAVAVAAVALVLNTSGSVDTAQQATTAGAGLALSAIEVSEQRFDTPSADALLNVAASDSVERGSAVRPASRSLAVPQTGAPPAARDYATAVRACERKIVGENPKRARATRYLVAYWHDTPAFLIVFDVPGDAPRRSELWVVRRDSCEVLYFAQRAR